MNRLHNPGLMNLLMTTTATSIRPTELERRVGRLLRGPDGHGEGDGAGGEGAGDGAGDGGEGGLFGGSGGDAGGDKSIMGGLGGDGEGDGDAGADGAADGSGSGDGDDTKSGEGEGEGDTKAQAEEDTVPEGDYELTTIKVGEGDDAAEYAVDNSLLAEVAPELKEAGLGTKRVQKLAETVVPKLYERFSQEQQDAFAATRADWAKAAKADPEIGGKNWANTEHNVAAALDHFVGPKTIKGEDGNETPNEFRKLLDETGLGNHPTMIRAFAKIGAQLGEDGVFARGGGGHNAPPKSREEILYPEDAPTKKS